MGNLQKLEDKSVESTLPRCFSQLSINGSTVSVILGDQHFRRTKNTESIFTAAEKYSENRTEENLEYLKQLLRPQASVATLFGGEFYKAEGEVFLQGTNEPVPEFIVEKLRRAERKGWDKSHLVNFWVNCLLNPEDRSRREFFNYCVNYGVPITQLGYAVLYKAVTQKEKAKDDLYKDLPHFVAAAYVKTKEQKKGPQRFEIYYNEEKDEFRRSEYGIQEGEEHIGNLQELHDNLKELSSQSKTTYTDKYTKKMDIKLGEIVDVPRNECNTNPRAGCASGLHVGAYEYVQSYGKSGDTILACLVNPRDVVCIPYDQNNTKMRTCAYLPFAVMEGGEEENWKELETEYFETEFAKDEFEKTKEEILAGNLDEEREEALKKREESLEEYRQDAPLMLEG